VLVVPGGLSPHALRHTFASLLFEAGATVPYVMAQLGHADPKVTLSIYAHVLRRKGDTGDRLDALVRAADWAATGSERRSGFLPTVEPMYAENEKTPQ
jgi:integrase